ncbi:MAG: hypothetical protein PHP57_10965 [Sideroxydans sp.]|nr:hypothetical protein [Sideroxydans sp.]
MDSVIDPLLAIFGILVPLGVAYLILLINVSNPKSDDCRMPLEVEDDHAQVTQKIQNKLR